MSVVYLVGQSVEERPCKSKLKISSRDCSIIRVVISVRFIRVFELN